ncbi:MAG: hypothetical protein M3209_10885 [Acidobacteriota bacterium]|nr:hypothetical protein [Acidobacteriota bacterium]
MKYWRFLFLAAVLAFSVPAFGQAKSNDDKILANGDPVLTESTVRGVRGVFEWIFESDFNARQTEAFRLLLIDYWQRGSRTDILVCLDYLKIGDVIAKIPENRREEARTKLRELTLTVINRQSNDPMSRILLEVSRNAKKSTRDFDKPVDKFALPPASNKHFPPKLIAR